MNRSLVTILVVDEDVMVRRVLETLLERDGFTVVSARNMTIAIQIMKATTIDLVLTDLPDSDQREIEHAAEVRALFPEAKVVVMSGYFGHRPPAASQLSAHACLTKPIRPEFLRQTVHALLGSRAMPALGVH